VDAWHLDAGARTEAVARQHMTEASIGHAEALGRLLSSEVILPVQFWSDASPDARSAPERRLMAAVLENAVMTLQQQTRKPSRHGRRLIAEIHTWVASNSRRHPFAFASICDVLGIDPAYLRTLIARETDSRLSARRQRRGHAGRGRHRVRLRRRRST
jgi:hypothetical protein